MPFLNVSPWYRQYFEGVSCPANIAIPVDDMDCYGLYPAFNFVYNKLFIAESQGIKAAPHGPVPSSYPVFSKPIYNLYGMGQGSRLLRGEKEYDEWAAPGHMWMEYLTGDHISSDVAVLNGEPVWWRHTRGNPLPGGAFDYWEIFTQAFPALEDFCGAWVRKHMRGYSGMMNFETIGGRIIEAHLRLTCQWPDLYGQGWLDAVAGLYSGRGWNFADQNRKPGYSVILFGSHSIRYRHPPRELQDRIRALPGVSSLQITFYEDVDPHLHSMPPGGSCLAFINCFDLEQGRQARRLAQGWFDRFTASLSA